MIDRIRHQWNGTVRVEETLGSQARFAGADRDPLSLAFLIIGMDLLLQLLPGPAEWSVWKASQRIVNLIPRQNPSKIVLRLIFRGEHGLLLCEAGVGELALILLGVQRTNTRSRAYPR